jgi:ABC-type multidrug transport system fused ATPase/permease subunit
MSGVAAPDLLNELWREQSRWSRAANRMKQRIERARGVALVVVVAVALFGTVAGTLVERQLSAGRVLAGLAAFGAALLPLLRPVWSGRPYATGPELVRSPRH